MNYPKILIDAINASREQYRSLGDYSTTQLIDPPRKVALGKRYANKVSPPIEAQVAAFIGTAIHAHFEKMLQKVNAKHPQYLLEKGVTVPIEVMEQGVHWSYRLLSGTFDILHLDKDLYDIKTCKVWKTIFDPDMVSWHQQQNIYAWLLSERGINVESINIIAVYMDWTAANAIRDRSYPQSPIFMYPLRLWSKEEQTNYIRERLDLHVAQEETPDEELPTCSREERWERFPDGASVQYALMKNPTSKRAMKCESTMEAIIKAANSMKVTGESFIEVRYAKRKRCETYCSVNEFCNHYRGYIEAKKNNTLNDIIPISDVR
jgi:hypothetical protein